MLESRDLDEPIGPNESQIKRRTLIGSDQPRKSWFYVFLHTRDDASGKGSSLDRGVKLAFKRFDEAYLGQTHVQYYSPASVDFHPSRSRFRLQRLPAMAVAEEDVFIKEESPARRNILQKLWGVFGGKKSAYPTLDREALKLLAKEEEDDTTALEDFLSDVHLKLVDEGIAAVDRKFLIGRMKSYAKVAGEVAKETVRVVKWP